MKHFQVNRNAEVRTAILAVFVCLVSMGFLYTNFVAHGAAKGDENAVVAAVAKPAALAMKYSKFPHSKHKRKSCSSCHKFPSSNWKKVRKDPYPDITDYPRHESCLSCHRRQFFGSARPAICTICHTNPSPRNSRRHPFSNPREIFDKSAKGRTAVTAFEINFPHETHTELLGSNIPASELKENRSPFVKASFSRKAAEESCSVCHQTIKPQGDSEQEFVTLPPKDFDEGFWLKKGTFKSVPIGHTNCFTCHSTETGIRPAPSDCATCHKPKPRLGKVDFDRRTAASMKISDKIMLTAWRKRASSAKFQHDYFAHVDMECSTCHTVDTMKTLVPATKKVQISSCAMCHVTETSDDGGALNLEIDARKADPRFQCIKCHISFGKLPIPATHIDAVKAQAGG